MSPSAISETPGARGEPYAIVNPRDERDGVPTIPPGQCLEHVIVPQKHVLLRGVRIDGRRRPLLARLVVGVTRVPLDMVDEVDHAIARPVLTAALDRAVDFRQRDGTYRSYRSAPGDDFVVFAAQDVRLFLYNPHRWTVLVRAALLVSDHPELP